MKVKKQIAFLLLFFQVLIAKPQDPQFSQFYAAPLYLGPSFAGMTLGSRAVVNYRDQWTALPGTFSTYSFSLDHNIMSIKSGVGLLMMRDQLGTGHLSFTTIGGCYSYRIQINRGFTIRPGLNLIYTQRGLDFFRLIFNDQISDDGTDDNTFELPPKKLKGALDFSTSVVGYTRSYWGGFTMDHLLRPNQSLSGNVDRVPYKYSIYGGAKVPIRGRMRALKDAEESLTYAFLYRQMGDWKQFDAGLYWNKVPIILGIWFRGIPFFKSDTGVDAIIFLAGIRYENFTIGYSYDVTISQLGISTGGSHEVSIAYSFNENLKIRHRRAMVPCPTF